MKLDAYKDSNPRLSLASYLYSFASINDFFAKPSQFQYSIMIIYLVGCLIVE
jgi:hypothetical protein